MKNENYQEIRLNINGEAKVYTDSDGVPHISSSTLEALFFAQGYIQGRDRLFQTDLIRHMASGTLASILGDSQIEHDFLIKSIGIPEMGDAAVNQLEAHNFAHYKAYIDGLNEYVIQNRYNLPIEYDLLKLSGLPMDYCPEPFEIADIANVLLLMSFQLNSNYGFNVGFFKFIDSIGLDTFKEYKPFLKINGEYNISQEDLVLGSSHRATQKSSHLSNLMGKFTGSNSWVISGNRTASGAPILCNDPHLTIGNPGILKSWYLECNDENVQLIGAQLPLVPGIILGRNKKVSWGITAPFYDCGDAWFETISENGSHYLKDDKYHPLVKKTIKIEVLGEEDISREINHVPGHGIMLNISGMQVSFRWSAMLDTQPENVGSNLLNAIYKMWFSENTGDIINIGDPTTGWDDLPLNVIFSTKEGDIGYLGLGRIPIRNNTKIQGTIPLDGTNSSNDWIRFVNAPEIPRVINPTSGFLYTANTKVEFPLDSTPPSYQAPAWGDSYRQNRIHELLQDTLNASIYQMQCIQGDLQDYWAPIMLDKVLNCLNENNISRESILYENAIRVLDQWDYKYSKGSTGATIYNSFMNHYALAILGDDLDLNIDQSHTDPIFKHLACAEILVNLTLVYDTSSTIQALFDITDTSVIETKADIIMSSFSSAIEELSFKFNANVDYWTWSDYNPLYFTHAFNSGSEEIAGFLNLGPFAADGGWCVRLQRHGEGAATRFINDWGDGNPTTSLVTPPGPSGNFISDNRKSEVDTYLDNELKVFPLDIPHNYSISAFFY